jgi:cell division ATPase FtsA
MASDKPNLHKASLAGASAPFLALDIGTQWVKAAAVQDGNIIGCGKVEQQIGNMVAGAVSNINAVAGVIRQAAMQAGVSPDAGWPCMAGACGDLVQCVLVTVEMTRRHPERPLSSAEVAKLAATTASRTQQQAATLLTQRTGLPYFRLELIDEVLTSISLDGCRVNDPAHFCGRHLCVTVLRSYAPSAYCNGLRGAIASAGWPDANLAATHVALAARVLPMELYEPGAVIIDIGAGSSNVVLADQQGMAGARVIGVGGYTFTRQIALELRCDLVEAEEVKLDYAAGALERSVVAPVQRAINTVWQVLAAALTLAFHDLKGHQAVLPRLFLCGGGSCLPGAEVLQPPGYDLRILDAATINQPIDNEGLLQGPLFVVLKALAAQGMVLSGYASVRKEGKHGS